MPRAFAVAVLGLGLLLQGCYAARVDSVSYADYESRAAVHVRVWNLWPHVKECRVVCEFNGWTGTAGVLMTPSVPQPESVRCEVDHWARVRAADQDLPPNVARARFYYGNEVLHEDFFPAPRWTTEFIEAGNVRRTGSGGAAGGAVTGAGASAGGGGGGGGGGTGAGAGAGPGPGPGGGAGGAGAAAPSGGRLSRDIDLPTPHDPARDLVTTVGQGASPQYARVVLPPGRSKVVIDVRSQGDPRSLDVTWWRVEVLDADGVPTGIGRQDFVRPGDETRSIDVWTFDGRPRIIKLASASAAGDLIRVRFERAE